MKVAAVSAGNRAKNLLKIGSFEIITRVIHPCYGVCSTQFREGLMADQQFPHIPKVREYAQIQLIDGTVMIG